MLEPKLCAICKRESKQFEPITPTFLENSLMAILQKCTCEKVQQCPHCFYASPNISLPVSSAVAKIVASEAYQKLANYSAEPCGPLVRSNYFAYVAHSFLANSQNEEKDALLAKLKAAECKRSTAFALKTQNLDGYPSAQWELFASIMEAEANAEQNECYQKLCEWANQQPQNSAIMLLLLKNTPLQKDCVVHSLTMANKFLQSNQPSAPIHLALLQEIHVLEMASSSF